MFFKNLFKKEDQKNRTDVKYLDTFEGHKIYILNEPSEMSYGRYFSFINSVQLDKNKLRNDKVNLALDIIDQCINDGNIARIAQITDGIRGYLSLSLSNDVYKELINNVIIIDDEPLDKTTIFHSGIKMKLYDNNAKARFFFITSVTNFLNKLANLPNPIEAEAYLNLETTNLKENTLSKVLNQNTGVSSIMS